MGRGTREFFKSISSLAMDRPGLAPHRQLLQKLILPVLLTLSIVLVLFTLTSIPGLNIQPLFFLLFSPQLAFCSFLCLGLPASFPFIFAALKLLFTCFLSLSFFLASARALHRLLKTRRFLHLLRPLSRPAAASGISYYLFPHSLPLAFTAGFLHPEIYVSEALALNLDSAELNVILHHELHHQQKHDPFQSLLRNFFSDFLFFIPVSSYLQKLSEISAEISADLFCLRHQIKRRELAQSFLKVSRLTFSGPSWFAFDQKARLEFLTKGKISFKPSLSRVLVSIALLIILFTIIFERGDRARVNSFLSHNSSCTQLSKNDISSLQPDNFSRNFPGNSDLYPQPQSQLNSEFDFQLNSQPASQLEYSHNFITSFSPNIFNNLLIISSSQ